MVVVVGLLRHHKDGSPQLGHAHLVRTQHDSVDVIISPRLPRQQLDALRRHVAPVLVEHVRVLDRRQDDVLERLQLLPHAAALAVHRHDREALSQQSDVGYVREVDANTGSNHLVHLTGAVENADGLLAGVGVCGAVFAVNEELAWGLVVVLVVGAVERFLGLSVGAPAPVSVDGLAQVRVELAFVLQVVGVPLEQRRHVEDLHRDGVRPLLVVQGALFVVRASAQVQFHAGHLRLCRHRHEEALVGESAMSLRPSHGVLRHDVTPAVVVAHVQFLIGAHVIVRVGRNVEGFVVQIGAVVVFARDLGHQLIEECVVLPSVHPLVGVEGVEGEAGSPGPLVLHQGLLVRHPGHQVVDDPETVHWQVTLEWMTQDAVVPLGDLRVGAVDHVHDGGRQVAEVLQGALAARVRHVPNLLLEVEPGRGVEEMTVAEERFLQRVGIGPCSLQVTQHRLEVLAVISHRVVAILPRLEPFSHLRDLTGDIVMLKHFRWDVCVGNGFDLVVLGAGRARHTEAVVVVARAELDPVEDGDEFTESDGAVVIGVVVYREEGCPRVRGRVVGSTAFVVMSHLRENNVRNEYRYRFCK